MDHNLKLLFRGTTRQAVVVFRPWIIGIEMKSETLSAWTLKKYNAFKTKGGRTVYDGGGILPDIEIESAKFSPITTAPSERERYF